MIDPVSFIAPDGGSHSWQGVSTFEDNLQNPDLPTPDSTAPEARRTEVADGVAATYLTVSGDRARCLTASLTPAGCGALEQQGSSSSKQENVSWKSRFLLPAPRVQEYAWEDRNGRREPSAPNAARRSSSSSPSPVGVLAVLASAFRRCCRGAQINPDSARFLLSLSVEKPCNEMEKCFEGNGTAEVHRQILSTPSFSYLLTDFPTCVVQVLLRLVHPHRHHITYLPNRWRLSWNRPGVR